MAQQQLPPGAPGQQPSFPYQIAGVAQQSVQQQQQQQHASGLGLLSQQLQQQQQHQLHMHQAQQQQQQQQQQQHASQQQHDQEQHQKLAALAAARPQAPSPPASGAAALLAGNAALLQQLQAQQQQGRQQATLASALQASATAGRPGMTGQAAPRPRSALAPPEGALHWKDAQARRGSLALTGGVSAAAALLRFRPDDATRLLPRSQLARLLEINGLAKDFRLDPQLEDWLQQVEEDLITSVTSAGAQLARRRKGGPASLRHTDCQPYLERMFHLHVPGFSTQVRPYRRPGANNSHRVRAAAVRQAMRKDADGEARGGHRSGGGGGEDG